MTTRTDVHRPSVIDPEAYTFVALEYLKIESPGDVFILKAEREAKERHMKMTGGTYSRHEHGGGCHICGAHCVYTALFYHAPTNSYIRTGTDCAEKLDMGDATRFRKFREACLAAEHAKAGKKKAEGLLAAAGYEAAWALYVLPWSDNMGFEENTIRDIVERLVKYGSISDKAMNYVGVLLEKIVTREARAARFAAERDAAKPCPTGRLTFTGTVLKVADHVSDFGSSLKMTVKADDGWVVWGTVPSSLVWVDGPEGSRTLKHGDRVELKATITPSDRDPKFGFFKRPSGSLVTEGEVAASN